MVNPKIWGRSGWKFLTATVAAYNNNPGIDMQYNYNRWFYHMRWTLPCDTCRANYEEHLRRWPIEQYLKSRAALFRWLMIMYNEVQTKLNKKTKGPQEFLCDLFGPEEGERLMQRLVYEDPDANITVIKPFDPTIAQYGGGQTLIQGPTILPDETLSFTRQATTVQSTPMTATDTTGVTGTRTGITGTMPGTSTGTMPGLTGTTTGTMPGLTGTMRAPIFPTQIAQMPPIEGRRSGLSMDITYIFILLLVVLLIYYFITKK